MHLGMYPILWSSFNFTAVLGRWVLLQCLVKEPFKNTIPPQFLPQAGTDAEKV